MGRPIQILVLARELRYRSCFVLGFDCLTDKRGGWIHSFSRDCYPGDPPKSAATTQKWVPDCQQSPLTVLKYPYNLLPANHLRKLPDFSPKSGLRLIFAFTAPDKTAGQRVSSTEPVSRHGQSKVSPE